MKHSSDMHDPLEIRCRKLGHQVTFAYCRKESIDKPCARIIECWMSRINVLEYLNNEFGTAFLHEFVAQGKKDKMSSIIELVEKSRKPNAPGEGTKAESN